MSHHASSIAFKSKEDSGEPAYTQNSLPASRNGRTGFTTGIPAYDVLEFNGSHDQYGNDATRDNLHAGLDRLLDRNKELRALNDRLMATNVELWKTNGRLETNNRELDRINRELTQLAGDYVSLQGKHGIGTLILDRNRHIRVFNPICAQFFNLLPQDVGQPADRFARNLSNRDEVLADIRTVLEHGAPIVRETRADKDSWFLAHLIPVTGKTGQVEATVIHFIDVASIKKDREHKRVLERIFEHNGEALLIADEKSRIIAANSSFTRLTGFSREEVLGKHSRTIMAGVKPKGFFAMLRKALRCDNRWQGEVSNRRKDGSVHSVWLSIAVLRNSHGSPVNYIASFSDISDNKQTELLNDFLAHHDPLTRLPNRFSLNQRLEQALELAKRDGYQLAVLFIDLDRFKEINDSLGHHIGDLLLIEVGARLTASMRGSDIIARLGGDEFVVALPHVQSAIDPAYLANKIQIALSQPYQLDGHEPRITPSIGISVYPHDGKTVEELLRNADTAMYHAKSRGRDNYQFFMREMHTIAQERLLLEHDLRLAIERNEFILHYQPQIDLATGLVAAVKAMLRWNHPLRGVITPDRFLAIADTSGLFSRIDHLCLEMACRQLAYWRVADMPPIRIAVKVSAKLFRDRALPELITAIISKTGAEPHLLELEITESATMGNPDETIRQLERLSEIGLQLSIDNFGAGYSSLSYVRRFPVNRLIIDRSFVKDIESNAGDAAIVAATISLAHSIGKQVTVKGIETENQLSFVTSQKCDFAQGYHFSRPLPAETISEFILHNHAIPATSGEQTGYGIF